MSIDRERRRILQHGGPPAAIRSFVVNIDVPDLAAATAFYCQAFRLRIGRRLGAEVTELLGGPAPIYLLQKAAGTQAAAAQRRDYARHWTPVHLDFVVEDIDAAVLRARQAGAALETAIATHAWGRIAMLADPFGNGFCLVQFLGGGYDEIATPPGPRDGEPVAEGPGD